MLHTKLSPPSGARALLLLTTTVLLLATLAHSTPVVATKYRGIAVGGAGVWLVDDRGRARDVTRRPSDYRWDEDRRLALDTVRHAPEGHMAHHVHIRQISVGKTEVWAVDSKHQALHRFPFKIYRHYWFKTNSRMKHVSVNDMNRVWGVGLDGLVYIFSYQYSRWHKIPGGQMRLKAVDTGRAGVWGLDDQGYVYYRNGTLNDLLAVGTDWIQAPGQKLETISAGAKRAIYGTDLKGDIYGGYPVPGDSNLHLRWRKLYDSQQLGGKVVSLDAYPRKLYYVTANRTNYYPATLKRPSLSLRPTTHLRKPTGKPATSRPEQVTEETMYDKYKEKIYGKYKAA